MTAVQGIDFSKFQGRVGRDIADKFADLDFKVVVVGLEHGNLGGNPHAEANLRDFREAGLVTAGYLISDYRDGRRTVDIARGFAGSEWEHLNFVSIDVEVPEASLVNIRTTADYLARLNKRSPIYTARWFWRERFGNPTDSFLKPLGLWNAYYDSDPDIDFGRDPYGPWTIDDVIGEQYQGTTPMFGTQVDLNIFRSSYIEEVDMPLTPQDENKIKAIIENALDAERANTRATARGLARFLTTGAVTSGLIGNPPDDPDFPRASEAGGLKSQHDAILKALELSLRQVLLGIGQITESDDDVGDIATAVIEEFKRRLEE